MIKRILFLLLILNWYFFTNAQYTYIFWYKFYFNNNLDQKIDTQVCQAKWIRINWEKNLFRKNKKKENKLPGSNKNTLSRSRIIFQNIIPDTKNFREKICMFIYDIPEINKYINYTNLDKDINKYYQKQYLFVEYSNKMKHQISRCFKIFNLTAKDKDIIKSRIIFFDKRTHRPLNVNDLVRFKDYKQHLLKHRILLKTLYNEGYIQKEKYNQNLYNVFVKRIFPEYYLNVNKDFIVLKYKDYQDYKAFKDILNKILNFYIKERIKFYKQNKIYQDPNPKTWYRNHDWEKCAVYTLTELTIFNKYLIYVLNFIYLDNRIKNNLSNLNNSSILNDIFNKEIKGNYIQNLLSLNEWKKTFKWYSNYYENKIRKVKWIWMSEYDIIQYYNWLTFSSETLSTYLDKDKRNKFIVLKWVQELYNPYVHFINVDIDIKRNWRWEKWWHIWLQLCNVKWKCYNYWPDLWYWSWTIKRYFYWKNRNIYIGSWFNILMK